MVFKERSKENRYKQVGHLYLLRWKFYEMHISYFLNTEEKNNVIKFFQTLRSLENGEIELLAERYYKSDEHQRYDKLLGDYTSVKPITLSILGATFDCEASELAEMYRELQIKIGENILNEGR